MSLFLPTYFTNSGQLVDYTDIGTVTTVETYPFTIVDNHCPYCDKICHTVAVIVDEDITAHPHPTLYKPRWPGWYCCSCYNIFKSTKPHIVNSATGKLAFVKSKERVKLSKDEVLREVRQNS